MFDQLYGDCNGHNIHDMDSCDAFEQEEECKSFGPPKSKVKTYSHFITKLDKMEVFVFGSNRQGFHGAGSAGFASFNEGGNVWRKYEYDKKTNGWKGCWNVKGVAEGFQKGRIGMSYAIPTVYKAGAKRSMPLETIKDSIRSFYAFALSTPKLIFYVAQDAKMGLNGYSPQEMAQVYSFTRPPDNVYFYEPFAKLLK